ncbi:MAG: hypothetical protein IPI02_21365 [Sterolibacteriaceae bacterium]|nr:hypothetical protein [Sterolibacteriaceae bacterium]
MSKGVSLNINTERFMQRILGKLFEHAGRALSEAMQNSRRAGASEVRFLVTRDPEDRTNSVVHIADDGMGIVEWQALLTVAESGWDESLIDKEDAFGIGFAAILFGCRELVVRSRGHELRLNWTDATNQKRFAVVESTLAPEKGTLIRLEGFARDAINVEARIRECAAGFALPVFLDDEELPAPYRLKEQFVATAVGQVWFREFGTDGAYPFGKVQAYYQGLPIRVQVENGYRCGEPSIVIHVDDAAFPATAPDRAGLCDPDKFQRTFEEAVQKHWEGVLRQLFTELSNEDFVDSYWNKARRFGCSDLLDRCPVLPAHILASVDGFSFLRTDGDSNLGPCETRVSRADVESGRIVLAELPSDDESDDGFAFLTLARLRGWVFVSDLPAEHWAHPYVISLDKCQAVGNEQVPAFTVEVCYVPSRSVRFCGRWVEAPIDLVERYAIVLKNATGEVVHSAEVEDCGLYRDGALIVPAKESGYLLCRQISRYLDENESFHEDAFEDDEAALHDLISELRGLSVGAIVGKALADRGVAAKPGVAGKAAIVIFGRPEDRWCTASHTHVIELSEAAIAEWTARHPEAGALNPVVPAIAPLVHALTAAADKPV